MKYKVTAFIAFAILLLFLASYCFPSLRMESSENRTMATFGMVLHPDEDSVVYHESPVERLDAALSDQFPFREAAVKRYLRLFNASENITSSAANLFRKKEAQQYVLHTVGDYVQIENTGYLTGKPASSLINSEILSDYMEQIEKIHERFPDLKIYLYTVRHAYDTHWFDSYLGTEVKDQCAQLEQVLPEYVKASHLIYQDLDEYMDLHFKTDHHCNYRGSYRMYEDIHAMLSEDMDLGEKRAPTAENRNSETYDYKLQGSYARKLEGLYNETEEFFFYEYDLPERKVYALDMASGEEIKLEKLGLNDEYIAGDIKKKKGTDHYVRMYGTGRKKSGKSFKDSAYPFVIRNSEGCGKNLLLAGDSNVRGFRDVLASHFDTAFCFDYRIFGEYPIDRIIEDYDIDVLVFAANAKMWDSADYYFQFTGDE